jgi:hypothetical protein
VAGAARLSQQPSAVPALVGLQEDGTFVAEVGGRAERGVVRLIAVGDDVVRASLKGLSFVAAKVFLQEAVEEARKRGLKLVDLEALTAQLAKVLVDLALQRRADLVVKVLDQLLPPRIPRSYTYYEFSYMGKITSVSAGLKADLSAAEPDTVTSLLDLFTELTSRAAEVGAGVEYTVEKDADRYTLKFSYSVRMPEKRAL